MLKQSEKHQAFLETLKSVWFPFCFGQDANQVSIKELL